MLIKGGEIVHVTYRRKEKLPIVPLVKDTCISTLVGILLLLLQCTST